MNICITHVYMKKWQKEQEEWILREQEKRREKIQDSTLQIGSKRYSFPIDLKKASDWPYDGYHHNSLCKHASFISPDKSESLLIGKTVDGLRGCSVRTGNAFAIAKTVPANSFFFISVLPCSHA